MTDQLPYSPEAETATIGGVLITPECLTDLHFLQVSDFYNQRNRWIWEALAKLHERRAPIDPVTLTNELDTMGNLKEIGGAGYITSLIANVPYSLNVEEYARIVEDKAIRRNAILAAKKIITAATDSETIEGVQEALNAAPNVAFRDSDSDNTFVDGLSKVYDRANENAERTRDGKPLEVGLTTGFLDLDRILLGIEAEESVIIGGRPGDGKTSFLLNIASHAALTLHKKVAIFSQEMSSEEVARRLVSSFAEIDSQRIKTGALRDDEWTKFTHAVEVLESSGLYVSDASNLTPAKLRAKCLKLQQTQGVDLVLVDYLQLMSAGVKTENRTREVGYISRQIKMLTRELKTPIVSACQLSRASEQRAEKRPTLSDLRDSGDIEQDANTVIFLYRPHKEDPNDELKNQVEAIVAKRRDGAVGSASLIYRPSITKFVNSTGKSYRFEE